MASDLAEGVGGLLQRAGQIFHVFDLSFFASGAATYAAIATALWLGDLKLPANTPIWVDVVIFVFGSYVSGVASFAVGRQLRRFSHYRRNLHLTLLRLLESHGLVNEPGFATYFDNVSTEVPVGAKEDIEHRKKSDAERRNAMAYRLYSRLWAELRDSYTTSEGYRMLSRYWVMAAMYDGLVFSFALWSAVTVAIATGWLGSPTDLQQGIAGFAVLLFLGLSYVCNREGLRNFEYQVEDICATFAALRAPLATPPHVD